jgi:hypothetical protein
MAKINPLLLGGRRSAKAYAADEAQQKLVSQRFMVWHLMLGGLIVGEALLWYFDAPAWILLVVPMGWLGLVVQNNALVILHELWELNDQLAGRKDEFRSLLRGTEEEPS